MSEKEKCRDVTWWNENPNKYRKEVLKLRRKYQTENNPHLRRQNHETSNSIESSATMNIVVVIIVEICFWVVYKVQSYKHKSKDVLSSLRDLGCMTQMHEETGNLKLKETIHQPKSSYLMVCIRYQSQQMS